MDKIISTATLIQSVHKVAERGERELGPEEFSFIEGCPTEWSSLPLPNAPLTVGIDGGYVHARDGDNRKAGWFEVIVGKSISTETEPSEANRVGKCFGFVNDYDKKPKRRLYEVLHSQGMQNNQEVTFLSDGGDSVRAIQLYLNPQARFILDWFHIAMRLTVLGQYVKGLSKGASSVIPLPTSETKSEGKIKLKKKSKAVEEVAVGAEAEAEVKYPSETEISKELESAKWYLWHGNVLKGLQVLEYLEFDLEGCELEKGKQAVAYQRVLKGVREFRGYIATNQTYTVNYGDRYRNGERISSSIAESTVDQVISKRFVKSQQMRWTKKGVHLLVQVRTRVLNEELEGIFQRWYPGSEIGPKQGEEELKKAG